MENNNREDLVFVSFDRIWANFKKFWWICAVLAVAMLLYGAATYKATSPMSGEKNDKELTDVVIEEDKMLRTYAGKFPVRIILDIDKYMEEQGLEVEATMMADFKAQILQTVIVETKQLLGYSDFTDAIEESYNAAGYKPLVISPGYVGDMTYDMFSIEPVEGSDNMYTLVYTGIGGEERIATGIKVAAEQFVKLMQDNFDYITIEPLSETTVQFRVIIFGFAYDLATTDEAFEAIKAQYADHNKQATGEVDKFDFSFEALFKVSTIIKGIVGFVIGFFIIFVIAICDKKVRTIEELERFFGDEGAFLGEIRRKSAVTEEVTAVSITSKCEKLGIGSILLTTVGKQLHPNQLADLSVKISNEKVKVVHADGIEVSAETTKAMAVSEGIVIVVNSGEDDVHTIKSALSRINTVEGKLLGYILSK